MGVGPFTKVDIGSGRTVDLYLLRYDKDGSLLGPQTEQRVRKLAKDASDVFVFSHGWNNTFDDAARKYTTFIEGYAAQRARLGLPTPADYRPLLVGVIWPSTSFLFPWEKGPRIAATPGEDEAQREEMLRLVGTALPPHDRAEVTELLDGTTELDAAEAARAAELVLRTVRPEQDPDDGSQVPSAAEFLDAWSALDGDTRPPADPDDFGVVDSPLGLAGAPQAAGGSRFDPRSLLRVGTVWLMKDRAGKVGARGVRPLLTHVLASSPARLHLVGHSFGARVVLSATAAAATPRPVHSMLLLQPAVNRWCFADKVIGHTFPGGYHPVLDRVERPIVATYSRHDQPLHEAFHLAVRGGSLGEPDIAAVGDVERYGALGGYGPAGIDDRRLRLEAQPEGTPYTLGDTARVVALDGGVDVGGEPAIDGHGDISTRVTWWLLHTLTGPR